MLSLGDGTTAEFFSREMKELCLKDKRLEARAMKILERLQNRLGSCIRRVFIDQKEARQAYDFF
jgi:hypothetical protein